jgi:hypothetical protein
VAPTPGSVDILVGVVGGVATAVTRGVIVTVDGTEVLNSTGGAEINRRLRNERVVMMAITSSKISIATRGNVIRGVFRLIFNVKLLSTDKLN